MSAILPLLLLLTAASGTAVVLVRDPARQVFAIAVNGLVLTVLFTALQAPDVALSELAVGAAAVPLLYLVAILAVRADRAGEDAPEGAETRGAEMRGAEMRGAEMRGADARDAGAIRGRDG